MFRIRLYLILSRIFERYSVIFISLGAYVKDLIEIKLPTHYLRKNFFLVRTLLLEWFKQSNWPPFRKFCIEELIIFHEWQRYSSRYMKTKGVVAMFTRSACGPPSCAKWIQPTFSHTSFLRSYILRLAFSSEVFPLRFFTEFASFYTFEIIIHCHSIIRGYKSIFRFTDNIVTCTTNE